MRRTMPHDEMDEVRAVPRPDSNPLYRQVKPTIIAVGSLAAFVRRGTDPAPLRGERLPKHVRCRTALHPEVSMIRREGEAALRLIGCE